MEILLQFLGVLFLIPFLVLYSSFSWGYVATIFYSWFIIPLFPQLPIFTWLQFAGMMFMINCFVHISKSNIKEEYTNKTEGIILIFINPWLTLLGGWILHLIY